MVKTRDQVIKAIDAWWKVKGYAPSMREIARMLGKPVSTIQYHFKNLRKDKLLIYTDEISRSVHTTNMKVNWKGNNNETIQGTHTQS